MSEEWTHGPETVPHWVPARMLNEYAYCRRLFYWEWVLQEFKDNVETIDGRYAHRRVDQPVGTVPENNGGSQDSTGDSFERIHARSVLVSSERLGLIARIDVLEGEGGHLTPIDYKRGTPPDVPGRVWEPEQVQLCAQALILQDNGYACSEGVIYYVQSKQRVRVTFDDELVTRTLELLTALRQTAAQETMPPPLADSPKCSRCSLVGICLPDEVGWLADPAPDKEVRRLFPGRDDALPMYIQQQGMVVGKTGERLQVRDRHGLVREIRLMDISQLCLFGNVQITAQALRELLTRDIPVCHFSYGGWFYGISHGMTHRNVILRQYQYQTAMDPVRALALARRFVQVKIQNSRTMLRRNYAQVPTSVLEDLKRLAAQTAQVPSMEALLGTEGRAARIYFSHLEGMLRPRSHDRDGFTFDFTARNRRPPRDPMNALLSFAYTLLVKDVTVTLLSVGFDPFLGFYHQPKYGRPALALDVMEEFRPIIADSVVLGVINNGEIGPSDVIRRAGGVALTPAGRKRFIEAYERRMDTLVAHPVFGYRISYRRTLEVQARLLGRYLAGEIPEYPAFRTR
ncbi:MAG: CRISPR-associated endonuclease Cas4/Cas1 [Sulfobacillus thermosulfidooxidans]|uniref:CRISPR-associated endonuclease Cas1 n=1 Tax=Sulfobacillus thermosulfidooxidans TaxID=28034 RepID=A0A2T2WN92_SULTH|nr:MAG: CRISPR-associated endonuclease Cas4/Cas1 [Sulfobacillus thermosulfidooxidans]